MTWITTEDEVACLGYACVIAKRHVVEPFERDLEHYVRHSPEDVERMAEAFRQAVG
jgi:hypothetical protein